MKKPVHIYDPVFRRNIYSFHQWSQENFASYMAKNYKIKYDNLTDYNGNTSEIVNGSNTIIILWTRKSNPLEAVSCLSHEAVHVTNMILKCAGVDIDTRNDELQAYHTSMIVRETLRGQKCLK